MGGWWVGEQLFNDLVIFMFVNICQVKGRTIVFCQIGNAACIDDYEQMYTQIYTNTNL